MIVTCEKRIFSEFHSDVMFAIEKFEFESLRTPRGDHLFERRFKIGEVMYSNTQLFVNIWVCNLNMFYSAFLNMVNFSLSIAIYNYRIYSNE